VAGFSSELINSLRSYDRRSFTADLASGLTVGVIALPLAIGFGVASGVTPAQGLWTGIVAGFLISALGGSRFQDDGGPTALLCRCYSPSSRSMVTPDSRWRR